MVMIANAIVFLIWLGFVVHERNSLAFGGLFLGATIGIYFQMYRQRRDEIRSMSEMVVVICYHDAAGVLHEIQRTSPSSFSNWSPGEKIRWVRRTEGELFAQAERDKLRGG